jgi:hypothetical protein
MKIFKLLTVLATFFTLTSCTFTEEITFEKNGSGKYDLQMDMGGMMDMMGAMQDSTSTGLPEKMDTIMYMKDLLEANSESIQHLDASDKAAYDELKDMKIHMKMDTETSEFKIDFLLDFKSITELDNILEKVKMAQKLQDNKVEEAQPSNHKVSYVYSKKKFERKVEMLKLTEEQQAAFDESMESSAMFMGGSTYKIKYNFPKKIKSTTLTDAVISEDGKTLTYEIEMDKALNDPKLLDFVVKF